MWRHCKIMWQCCKTGFHIRPTHTNTNSVMDNLIKSGILYHTWLLFQWESLDAFFALSLQLLNKYWGCRSFETQWPSCDFSVMTMLQNGIPRTVNSHIRKNLIRLYQCIDNYSWNIGKVTNNKWTIVVALFRPRIMHKHSDRASNVIKQYCTRFILVYAYICMLNIFIFVHYFYYNHVPRVSRFCTNCSITR